MTTAMDISVTRRDAGVMIQFGVVFQVVSNILHEGDRVIIRLDWEGDSTVEEVLARWRVRLFDEVHLVVDCG